MYTPAEAADPILANGSQVAPQGFAERYNRAFQVPSIETLLLQCFGTGFSFDSTHPVRRPICFDVLDKRGADKNMI
ncbi:hypothetical protein EJB05_28530, partial [Eragrostis curvula]